MTSSAETANLLTVVIPLVVMIICGFTLYGCYLAFDRLQTRAEQTTGGQRWIAIGLASGVGLVTLLTFWCCFAFSTGFFHALGL